MPPSNENPDLSISEALDVVDRATHFTQPLRRRAEGITIAAWGFILMGIALSSGVMNDLHGFMHAGGWKRWISMFTWLPWTVFGILFTLAVWRMAEVSLRNPLEGRRRSWKTYAAWFGVMLVLLILMVFVVPVAQAGIAVGVVGIIWLGVGGLGLYNATRQGRRTVLVIGTVMLLVGIVYGSITGANNDLGWKYYTIVAVLTNGLVPVLGGLWQALRS